jgi:hypothetical protein
MILVLCNVVSYLSPLFRLPSHSSLLSVYLHSGATEEEIARIESALGERCNDILVDTGLFIISAVYE